MATSIDVFIPNILPSVIGCPDFSMRSAVIESAIELCTKASAWTETMDLVLLRQGSHSYEIDLPKDARVLLVKNVWASKGELTSKTMTEIAGLIPDWQTAQGEPRYFNQLNWEEFRVYPIPNSSNAALTVRASLAPLRTSTTLPTSFVDRYFQGIVAGAIARLAIVPGQAWSNPQLAAYYKTEFNTACGEAKVEIFHDRVAGSMRVTPRRFGG